MVFAGVFLPAVLMNEPNKHNKASSEKTIYGASIQIIVDLINWNYIPHWNLEKKAGRKSPAFVTHTKVNFYFGKFSGAISFTLKSP
jgi:hypothetical protein